MRSARTTTTTMKSDRADVRGRWQRTAAALVVAILTVWSLEAPARALGSDETPAPEAPYASSGDAPDDVEVADNDDPVGDPDDPGGTTPGPADSGDEADRGGDGPGEPDGAAGDEEPHGPIDGQADAETDEQLQGHDDGQDEGQDGDADGHDGDADGHDDGQDGDADGSVDGDDVTAASEPVTVMEAERAEVEAAVETVLDDGVQILHTGQAVAIGNLSEDRVVQLVDVLVFDGSSVRIEQIVIIVNIGQALATTGGNTAATATGSTTPSSIAQVTTSDAVAIGNASETELDQQLAIDVDQGSVTGEQHAAVTNTGVAVASSGGNVAIAGGAGAGSVAVSTGNAYALGNYADNLIEQAGTVAAGGSAVVITDQQSIVLNRGLALADSGDNTALAGSGGLAVSSTSTGVAFAEGNVSSTTVEQRVVAIAAGDASVTMRQGALVLNLGVAWASTGGNQVGALAGPGAVTAGFDALDEGLLELVLLDLRALDDLAAWFASWLGPVIGHDLTVDRVTASEHLVTSEPSSTTEVEDQTEVKDPAEERGRSRVWLRQLALILDLGFASASTGDNVVAPGPVVAAASDGSVLAETRATIHSGEAFAIGNVAVTLVCQRLRVSAAFDARRCAPPALPAPPVRPAPIRIDAPEPALAGPIQLEPEPVEPEPIDAIGVEPAIEAQPGAAVPTPVPLVEPAAAAVVPVRQMGQDVRSSALPATGADASVLVVRGLAAMVGGLLALLAARPARPHRAQPSPLAGVSRRSQRASRT